MVGRAGDRTVSWSWVGAIALALAYVSGCAAPGPPLPPTLNLPQVQTIYPLSAVRVGERVRLHWTTPAKTTDKLAIRGEVWAVLCRSVGATVPAGCDAVMRVRVTSGATDVEDALPASLTAGAPGLVAYRVRLLNSAGRDAGASAAVYAASGAAPAEVAGFVGEPTRDGVELRWLADSGAATVELERTVLSGVKRKQDAAAIRMQAAAGTWRGAAVAEPGRIADAGGMIDRTVEIGGVYRYAAERVLWMTIEGHPVQLRSAASEGVTVAVRDAFAPAVPTGLIAVPAFAEGGRGAIDLSWDAVMEQEEKPRLAGYAVYRREGDGAWRRIGPGLVRAAAYRDTDVAAGQRYAYRVTAMSTAGNESAPSGEAEETAPQAQ